MKQGMGRNHIRRPLFACTVAFLMVINAEAAKHYLDTRSTGRAEPSGTLRENPWNNVQQLYQYDSVTGFCQDTILIACGCTVRTQNMKPVKTRTPGYFFGNDTLWGVIAPSRAPGCRNTTRIVIDTFIPDPSKTALPIIDAQGKRNSAGIVLYNQSNWTIRNIEVRNNLTVPMLRSAAAEYARGVSFIRDALMKLPVGLPNEGTVDSLLMQGWRWGILAYGDEPGATFSGITIERTIVDSVYSSVCGELSPCYPDKVHVAAIEVLSPVSRYDNITIAHNHVFRNTSPGIIFKGPFSGWTNLSTNVRITGNKVVRNSGDGIFVSGAENPRIDSNYVFGAGTSGRSMVFKGNRYVTNIVGANIAGIWVWGCSRGLVEYNQVDSTKRLPGDGQAFDLDGAMSGTTIFQYNTSKNNEGGVFMDCTDSAALGDDQKSFPRAIFRFNTSVNDGCRESRYPVNYPPWSFITYSRGGHEFNDNSFYSTDTLVFFSAWGKSMYKNKFSNNTFKCKALLFNPEMNSDNEFGKGNVFTR